MNESGSRLQQLSEGLGDPDYLYLLQEPVFIYGIGFGLLGFVYAFIAKETRTQIVTLALVAASALVILPYLKQRGSASERITRIYKVEAPSRVAAFEAANEDWRRHRALFLALAACAGTAAFVGPRRNRLGLFLAIATLILGTWAVVYAISMHYRESVATNPHLKHNDSPVREAVDSD